MNRNECLFRYVLDFCSACWAKHLFLGYDFVFDHVKREFADLKEIDQHNSFAS